MTRKAYGLDRFSQREFPAGTTVDATDPANNQSALQNIRLWDWHFRGRSLVAECQGTTAGCACISGKFPDINALISEAGKDFADYDRLTAEGKLGEPGGSSMRSRVYSID